MRLYDRDFLEWTEATVQAIRTGRWNDIDREALAEEIEDLGKRDRREVISRLQVLLQHLLKCKYQPEQQSSTWLVTINEQRRQLALLFEDSPSLRAQAEKFIENAYPEARRWASEETDLDKSVFPEVCEWSTEEVLGFQDRGAVTFSV
ncbi:MAG: DUF29 domain-containing protein [Acidobacteriaceae bacterium]|nr:DUF29 domain-containing protein [Acidobacteriaceae bacterium]